MNNDMTAPTAHLTELKAKAYDILAGIEQLNLQLQEVNKQIAAIYQGEQQPEPELENA